MIIKDKRIIEELKKHSDLLFSHSESFKSMSRKIDDYNAENYKLNVIVRALLNYLKVDIHKELVADPRIMPSEPPMTEIIVLKKIK